MSSVVSQIWRDEQHTDDLNAALAQQRESLAEELADCLAYLVKLANYAGIDLEAAYLTKMRRNLGREWRKRKENDQA